MSKDYSFEKEDHQNDYQSHKPSIKTIEEKNENFI